MLVCLPTAGYCVWSSESTSFTRPSCSTSLSVPQQSICSWLRCCIPRQQTPLLSAKKRQGKQKSTQLSGPEEPSVFIWEIHWPKQNNQSTFWTVSCLSFLPDVSSHSLVSSQLWIWMRVLRITHIFLQLMESSANNILSFSVFFDFRRSDAEKLPCSAELRSCGFASAGTQQGKAELGSTVQAGVYGAELAL